MLKWKKKSLKKYLKKKKKKKLSSLILTVFLSQFIHKLIEMWLVILNSKNQGQKRPQSNKINLRIFCEKNPFLIHYF